MQASRDVSVGEFLCFVSIYGPEMELGRCDDTIHFLFLSLRTVAKRIKLTITNHFYFLTSKGHAEVLGHAADCIRKQNKSPGKRKSAPFVSRERNSRHFLPPSLLLFPAFEYIQQLCVVSRQHLIVPHWYRKCVTRIPLPYYCCTASVGSDCIVKCWNWTISFAISSNGDLFIFFLNRLMI